MDRLLTDNEIFISRTLGIGRLWPLKTAIDFGSPAPCCGPRALTMTSVRIALLDLRPLRLRRAAGHAWRLLRPLPGSSRRRSASRANRAYQALDQLPEGPILPDRMPRLLRPAAGEVYMHCEDPRGEYGVYLVSKGATQPYRLRMLSLLFLQPFRAEAHDGRPLCRRRCHDPRFDRHRFLRGGPLKGT